MSKKVAMPSDTPSKALMKRSASTSLMAPPPAPKRIKRPSTVLDEDTYTEALSHIIARDFFPGLLETKMQQEYLDALDSKDGAWIAEAGKKLTDMMTPRQDTRGRRGVSMTPVYDKKLGTGAGETPRKTALDQDQEEEEGNEKKPQVDLNMSLSAFQAKYTSEDNESFNALLDRQNEKRAEKYAWVWNENRIPSARQIIYRKRETQLLEAKESKAEDRSKALVARDPDTRPAMVDTKSSAPKNAFMFNPESIEDTHQTIAQAAEEASLAPPKTVRHDNTRFQSLEQSSPRIPASPSLSAINDAIAGRPRPTDTDPGYNGSETPRVAGYAFVDAEPEPGEGSSAVEHDPSKLLSQLRSADKTPNPFTIKEASRREGLHHRLVDSAAKKKRSAAGNRLREMLGGDSPRSRNTPLTRGNLTPAAQKLFQRVDTPSRSGLGATFGGSAKDRNGVSSFKKTWTPTPKIKK
jgi:protein DGCR14